MEPFQFPMSIWKRFAARFPGAEALGAFRVANPAPVGKEGRVDAFPSKERADLAWLCALIGFFEDPELFCCRELPTPGLCGDFRVWSWGDAGLGVHRVCP